MRADRLISLVLLLQETGRTTTALVADELGVSRRTVLRDLEALSLSGIPVLAEGGPGGGVWLDPNYRTSLTGMKESDLRMLLVNTDGRLLDDLGWGEAFRESQRKLKAAVPARFEPGVEFVRRRLVIDSRWWWHETESGLETLQAAVWGDRIVEGWYEGRDGAGKPVQLEAYGLVAKAGLWYFVGRREGEWRTYRVSRFVSIRSAGRFAREADFDLAQWWSVHAKAFASEFSSYRFVLALPETQLVYLKGIAPGRVECKGPHTGRSGWIEAEVGLDSAVYAELVVLGLGADCLILENEDLKRAVVRRANQALAAHARVAEPPPPRTVPGSPRPG